MAGVDWAPWAATAIATVVALAGGIASHVRLESSQRSDRELLQTQLASEGRARTDALKILELQLEKEAAARADALKFLELRLEKEAEARAAADLLADEKIKGWAERLKSVQAEQDRTRDVAEKVGRLAQAVEGLAERLSEGQDRNDERFEQIRAAIAEGKGR